MSEWYTVKSVVPYMGDPDYFSTFVAGVKRIGGAIDPSLRSLDQVDVFTDKPDDLERLPLVGSIRLQCDRGIRTGLVSLI